MRLLIQCLIVGGFIGAVAAVDYFLGQEQLPEEGIKQPVAQYVNHVTRSEQKKRTLRKQFEDTATKLAVRIDAAKKLAKLYREQELHEKLAAILEQVVEDYSENTDVTWFFQQQQAYYRDADTPALRKNNLKKLYSRWHKHLTRLYSDSPKKRRAQALELVTQAKSDDLVDVAIKLLEKTASDTPLSENMCTTWKKTLFACKRKDNASALSRLKGIFEENFLPPFPVKEPVVHVICNVYTIASEDKTPSLAEWALSQMKEIVGKNSQQVSALMPVYKTLRDADGDEELRNHAKEQLVSTLETHLSQKGKLLAEDSFRFLEKVYKERNASDKLNRLEEAKGEQEFIAKHRKKMRQKSKQILKAIKTEKITEALERHKEFKDMAIESDAEIREFQVVDALIGCLLTKRKKYDTLFNAFEKLSPESVAQVLKKSVSNKNAVANILYDAYLNVQAAEKRELTKKLLVTAEKYTAEHPGYRDWFASELWRRHGRQDEPSRKVYQIENFPEADVNIDGVLEESPYKDIEPITDFNTTTKGSSQDEMSTMTKADFATKVFLFRSDDWLYVAMHAEEPRMHTVNAKYKEHDAQDVWRDDSMELFIASGPRFDEYQQWAFNTNGAVLDLHIIKGKWSLSQGVTGTSKSGDFNPRVSAAGRLGKGQWFIEARIHTDDIKGFAEAEELRGGYMYGNVRRLRWERENAPNRIFSWSHQRNATHSPTYFNLLHFK